MPVLGKWVWTWGGGWISQKRQSVRENKLALAQVLQFAKTWYKLLETQQSQRGGCPLGADMCFGPVIHTGSCSIHS